MIRAAAPEFINEEDPLDSTALLSIVLGAPTSSLKESCEANILSIILGGDAESRLYNKISEKMGLAYAISSMYDGSSSRIFISADIKAIESELAIDAIYGEIKKRMNKALEESF